MRNFFSPISLFLLISVSLIVWVNQATARSIWLQKVDPQVWETAVSQNQAEFLIILTDQADLTGAEQLSTKLERGRFVYETATAVAQRTQPAITTLLDANKTPYRRFWVRNMIWAKGETAVIRTLAQREDVARIEANPHVQLALAPPAKNSQTSTVAQGIEPNISQINAPAVWAAGFTGTGVVIGGQDTGYDWQHPALINQYRGSGGDHSYAWHDAIHVGNSNGNSCGYDTTVPCDDFGHGTHTLGTMIGDDGAGNQVGVAPGATWIGCRNMDNGNGTPATYTECYEWFIAPYPQNGNPLTDGNPAMAPDVINNSWSCPPSEGCAADVLKGVVHTVRMAGILTVQAASNSGPSCSSINTPAAIYDDSFTIGAVGSTDQIASFSSRGPVTVGDNNPAKPDMVAPGISIRSSRPSGAYGNSNGTSMAAPHIVGVTALLISAEPALAGNVDLLERLMWETAVSLTTLEGCGDDSADIVPNNTFGWGRVDALAAYQAIPENHATYLPFSVRE